MKLLPEVIESLRTLREDVVKTLEEAEADNDRESAEISKGTLADIDEALAEQDNQ